MKKLFMGLGMSALLLSGTAFGQNAKKVPVSKKNAVKYEAKNLRLAKLGVMENLPAYADPNGSLLDNTGIGDVSTDRTQAINVILIGKSGNVYSIINSSTNQVFTYKLQDGTQVVGFAHRNDNTNFAGSGAWASGIPRFDLSVDGGNTWQVDLGPMMVDDGAGNLGSLKPRYPQGVLTNPLGGTTVADLRLVETGTAWVNQTPSGFADWGWPLRTLGWDLENFSAAQTNDITANLTKWFDIPQARIPGGVEGYLTWNTYNNTTMAWVTNTGWDIVNETGLDTIYLGKIEFQGNADSLTTTWIKFAPNVNKGRLGDAAVAFSPDGKHGWLAFDGDLDDNGDPNLWDSTGASFAQTPCFYHSSDGGATWSNTPIAVDLTQFQEITDVLKVVFVDTAGTPVDSTTGVPFILDFDLVVDYTGNPHFVVTASNYYRSNPFPHPDSLTYLTISPKVIFDLYSTDMGNTWKVKVLDTLWYGRWYQDIQDTQNSLWEWAWTQASRSYDGKVIAYGWINDPTKTDTSFSLNTGNSDLFIAAWRLTDDSLITKRNVSGGSAYSTLIFWPQLSQTLLDGANPGDYIIPVAFTKAEADVGQTQWYYISDITVSFGQDTTSSGISQIYLDGFAAYPNPVKSVLNVEWTNTQPAVMEILDIQGRVISSKDILPGDVRESIDLSQVPAGVYLLKVTNAQGVFTHKFIKQ